MKSRGFALTVLILGGSLVGAILPACTAPAAAAQKYVAVLPKTLRSGSTEGISVSLFRGNQSASGRVEATLLKAGKTVTTGKADVNGRGMVNLNIPDVEEGAYEVRLKGNGFDTTAPVKIERNFLIFLETDKPIYKPGQTIEMRAMTLNAELKPASELVMIEVLDAKGIKIFRSEVVTDEFGMASLDLPISNEPNLGVWKINAATAKTKTELDVTVDKYVLPKYEVKVDLSKEWFLAGDKISGTVSAEYSFGRPVSGELEIKASRYVGQWQQYATATKAIDTNTTFEIPAAGYVAGVPAAGGSGNVMLDVTVREKSTGYEEKTNRLLTVAASEVNLQVIPDSSTFKPGLPFSFLVVTQTPANQPVDASAKATITYLNSDYKEIKHEDKTFRTVKGKALVEVNPPQDSVALAIDASTDKGQASTKLVTASYSPSGNFIHIEQTSQGVPKAGEAVTFKVYSTREAANFYYEVISRGAVVFSNFSKDSNIEVNTTPMMAPTSRLVVYQVLPNSEVAADYLPFDVQAAYPQNVSVQFSKPEAKPGDKVDINIKTEGEAKVGLAAVDRSVFILAEDRVNLQQVFDQLENLYMKPQVELHDATIYPSIETKGAKDTFDEAGVTVLTNNNVPEGKDYPYKGQQGVWSGITRFLGMGGRGGIILGMEKGGPALMVVPAPTTAPAATHDASSDTSTAGLAEVQRIRQFFPETWLWDTRIVGANGRDSVQVTVPDTITTWMLHAVAISKDKGLGMAEDQLRAFQPFFLTVDLPYSAIRGEEFPVSVAVYNYLAQPQSIVVHIDRADWFDLSDEADKTIEIKGNDIGSTQFKIRPTKLGANQVKITARSTQAADGVVKDLIVDAEGVPREDVENITLSNGSSKTLDTSLPPMIVDGSGRVYLALTSSYLAQTMDGLDALIQMPFGCGEQNMILLAPDIFVTKYLAGTGQLKPEIMAKAEKLMITGYQRELTYRRADGSFSAFGESDKEGSLWLTAFVLKTFAQAKSVIYVDDSVLGKATAWITAHQNGDGSFDQVGFVHHQEMLGGVQGKNALTAYVATALLEAGEKMSSGKAVSYLEGQLDKIDDAYTMAITSYALELAKSARTEQAHTKLMGMAREDQDGIHWGEDIKIVPEPQSGAQPKVGGLMMPPQMRRTTEIETTACATLALLKHGDALNSSRASKWLVSRRNAHGGYGSTQDTVVTLQALTEQATGARADVDLTVNVKAGNINKNIRITQRNFDVLQMIEVPPGQQIEVSAQGKGEVIGQLVSRYNLPQAEKQQDETLKVNVDYDVTQVAVNDLVGVSVSLQFNPPVPMEAGMIVLDVSVPTGFAPVDETIAQVLRSEPRIKRYDVAGRKVIFYVEDMKPGDKISFGFKPRAPYPVKGKGVASQAFS